MAYHPACLMEKFQSAYPSRIPGAEVSRILPAGLTDNTTKVKQFTDICKYIYMLYNIYTYIYTKSSGKFLNMLQNIFQVLAYYSISPYLCTSLRIVGNAEERPMNVKAALTTERGEDVKTPRRFFISEDYRNRVNILPIRSDKF